MFYRLHKITYRKNFFHVFIITSVDRFLVKTNSQDFLILFFFYYCECKKVSYIIATMRVEFCIKTLIAYRDLLNMRIVIAQTQQGFSTSRRMIEPSNQLFFIQCEQVIYFCLLQMKPEKQQRRN